MSAVITIIIATVLILAAIAGHRAVGVLQPATGRHARGPLPAPDDSAYITEIHHEEPPGNWLSEQPPVELATFTPAADTSLDAFRVPPWAPAIKPQEEPIP